MHARTRLEPVESPLATELRALRRMTPFRALERVEFEALCHAAQALRLGTRAELVTEGVRPVSLHVVLEGCAELYARRDEREATVGLVRRGGSFVLPDVVRDLPALASARTCAPSRLLLLPAADVRIAVERDRGFARALLDELADAQRAQLRANKDIKLRSALERLANRLIRYEREQGGNGSLVLPCDKRTLASLLGMTPENLSRAFATLGTVGVRVDGRSIALDDPEALAAVARPDPLIDGRRARRRAALDA